MGTQLEKLVDAIESKIEAKQAEIEDKQKEIDYFEPSDYIDHDQYDEMLDDCYPEVEYAGFTCEPSRALKELDPVAYRCGYADYCSTIELDMIPEYEELTEELEVLESELEDLESELEEAEEELEAARED